MKIVKVLGTGCPNCVNTEKVVAKAAEELNLTIQLLKVTDIQAIMAYDILSTPAVVINEKVVIKGRVPNISEMKELLKDEACCCDSDESSDCCSSSKSSNSCCDTDTNCC